MTIISLSSGNRCKNAFKVAFCNTTKKMFAKLWEEVNFMKKFLKLLMTMALVVCCFSTFVACGGSSFDPDKNIQVVTREDGSGTKSAFMEIIGLKGKSDVSGVIVQSTTAGVLNAVKTNNYTIGYDSLGYVTDEVKMLKVDGVDCTVENIKNGSYKISRPLSIVYKQDTISSGAEKAFYDFLQSSDAQSIIGDNGYVSIKDNTSAYTVVSGLTGDIQISGSTSLQPLMEKLEAKFEQLQPNVNVTVAGGGSGTGYNNAENGTSDFGMISEEFKQTKAPNCTYNTVAKDGIAVIVNKNNTNDNITMAQLKAIYNVEAGDNAIKVWNQIA